MSDKKKDDPNKASRATMTVDEYRDKLHDYSAKYLACKDIRHVWTITAGYAEVKDTGMVSRVLECKRCRTVRTDYYRVDRRTQRMERGYSNYRYPAGFSIRGIPRDEKPNDILRYEAFLRFIATPTKEIT